MSKSQMDSLYVHVDKNEDGYILVRGGQPYYIKGIGGSFKLDIASQCGANSLRTWSSHNAGSTLDAADEHGMTVMLGIELSKDPQDYLDEEYKEQKRSEVKELLSKYKEHPALLLWALGNEIDLRANNRETWEFVDELAQIIRSQDTSHPVSTVISGAKIDVMNKVAQYVPTIEVMGVNVYGGGIFRTRKVCEESCFEGPFIISEWGPYGHWEVEKTSWNVPIEQTSAQKAATYEYGYTYISDNKDLFLGSYVFLWGQKEERTPTWYGMFLENNPDLGVSGECCPTVDVMQHAWSGSRPSNQAPVVTSLKLNGLQANQDVQVEAGQKCTGMVEASDPDGDEMTILWEILKEATVFGFGGSYEPRPERVGDVVTGTNKEIVFNAPEPGEYRLYAYVLDGQGHAGTVNIPFRVK